MLDMGFLPDIKRDPRASCRGSGRRCSSRPPCRAQIVALSRAAARARPPSHRRRAQVGARDRRHAGDLPGAPGPQVAPPARACSQQRRHRQRAGLHPHQAPRQPARRLPRAPRRRLRPHPRQPQPGAAHRGARRLQGRPLPRAGRDRHRRPRHRRRGAVARRQLRRAEPARGLHPPRRPHRARRRHRRRVDVRSRTRSATSCARSSARSASRSRAAASKASTTRRSRRSDSRSRSPSGWRRIGAARRTIGREPRPSASARRRHRPAPAMDEHRCFARARRRRPRRESSRGSSASRRRAALTARGAVTG